MRQNYWSLKREREKIYRREREISKASSLILQGFPTVQELSPQPYPFLHHLCCSCMHAKSLQLCLTLCDPMDCIPPGSSVHGILQARIMEWIASITSVSLMMWVLVGSSALVSLTKVVFFFLPSQWQGEERVISAGLQSLALGLWKWKHIPRLPPFQEAANLGV